jgi:hypothetical protein
MKHACVVSLVVAALALVVAPGCGSGGSTAKGGGGAHKVIKPNDELPIVIKPPGLMPGLTEIYKSAGGGADQFVGYVWANAASEAWVLTSGYVYPVPLNVNDTLKFTYLGPQSGVDVNPKDGDVTSEELCASSWCQGWINGSKWTVIGTVSMDGTCH